MTDTQSKQTTSIALRIPNNRSGRALLRGLRACFNYSDFALSVRGRHHDRQGLIKSGVPLYGRHQDVPLQHAAQYAVYIRSKAELRDYRIKLTYEEWNRLTARARLADSLEAANAALGADLYTLRHRVETPTPTPTLRALLRHWYTVARRTVSR